MLDLYNIFIRNKCIYVYCIGCWCECQKKVTYYFNIVMLTYILPCIVVMLTYILCIVVMLTYILPCIYRHVNQYLYTKTFLNYIDCYLYRMSYDHSNSRYHCYYFLDKNNQTAHVYCDLLLRLYLVEHFLELRYIFLWRFTIHVIIYLWRVKSGYMVRCESRKLQR